MDYKAKVLEYYGSEMETDYDKWANNNFQIKYTAISTADDYQIFNRNDGGSTVFYDEDLFYYAENCYPSIVDDIKEGMILFVDEEIAHECGLGSDEGNSWQWQELYEEFYEEEDDDTD